jgi:hypothetical protein
MPLVRDIVWLSIGALEGFKVDLSKYPFEFCLPTTTLVFPKHSYFIIPP